MAEEIKSELEASPEQVLYANLLSKGMLLGLVILFITYTLYVLGIMKPYIPVEKLSGLWGMSVHDYLQNPEFPLEIGWAWLSKLQYGDFINYIGIVFLAGVTIVCYAAIILTLLKNDDKVYAALAGLEVLILSLAASGILAVSGH